MTAETQIHATEAKTFTLRVSYNGVVKSLEHVQPNASAKSVLERAVALFPGVERPHQQALYREDGTEVPTEGSVSAAGLRDDQLLVLRPRTVQGG